MDATTEVRLSRARSANPEAEAFRLLTARGQTIAGLARELGEKRQRVQSWFSSLTENQRPIPRRIAQRLERRYGIPLTAWKKLGD